MTTIDYKALAERVRDIAEGTYLTEPERADIRTVVSLLDGMADMEPAARIYTDAELVHRDPRWGRVCWIVPECEIDGGALLYLHPAPQPQPEQPPEGAIYGIIDPDYGRVYTIARKLAWEEGYAIGLHGSFTRDLDMIAVPWVDTACEPEHLIRRIADAAGLKVRDGFGVKPHGRLAWTLKFPAFGDPRFIDLSIMPRVLSDSQPERQPVSEAPGCWLFSNPEGTHKIEASSLGGLLSGIRSRFPDKCEPTEAQIERLHNALIIAEAALADIGDADREPGDDLAWCEQRAAEALPTIRAALARIEQERSEQAKEG